MELWNLPWESSAILELETLELKEPAAITNVIGNTEVHCVVTRTLACTKQDAQDEEKTRGNVLRPGINSRLLVFLVEWPTSRRDNVTEKAVVCNDLVMTLKSNLKYVFFD